MWSREKQSKERTLQALERLQPRHHPLSRQNATSTPWRVYLYEPGSRMCHDRLDSVEVLHVRPRRCSLGVPTAVHARQRYAWPSPGRDIPLGKKSLQYWAISAAQLRKHWWRQNRAFQSVSEVKWIDPEGSTPHSTGRVGVHRACQAAKYSHSHVNTALAVGRA